MSVHRSLVTKGKLALHRNVLSRSERIKRLLDEGRWQEGQSVFGLAKVRSIKMRPRKKAKKEAEAEVPAEGAAAPAEGAAPAAGAPAKGAAPAAGAPAKGAAPSKGAEAPAKTARKEKK